MSPPTSLLPIDPHSLSSNEASHRSTLIPEYTTTRSNDLTSNNQDSSLSFHRHLYKPRVIIDVNVRPHHHILNDTRPLSSTPTLRYVKRVYLIAWTLHKVSTLHRTSKTDCNLISPMHCNQTLDSVRGTSTSRVGQNRLRHENQTPMSQYLPSVTNHSDEQRWMT